MSLDTQLIVVQGKNSNSQYYAICDICCAAWMHYWLLISLIELLTQYIVLIDDCYYTCEQVA